VEICEQLERNSNKQLTLTISSGGDDGTTDYDTTTTTTHVNNANN